MEKFVFNQNYVNLIPGMPMAYWFSKNVLLGFKNNKICDYSYNKAGVVSGDDNYFVRCWYEIKYPEICFYPMNKTSYSKYHIFCKGGDFRRYYGNYLHVIKLRDLYDPNCYNRSIRRGDQDSYFKKCISWSIIGSLQKKSFRLVEHSVCGTASPSIFIKDDSLLFYFLGLLNSKYSEIILSAINPTLNLQSSDVGAIPVCLEKESVDLPSLKAKDNFSICKQDWDSFETSWEFKKHPLI